MSNRRDCLAVRRDDFYKTPREAVTALLAVEPDMPRVVWEPACGDGAIVRPLREAGFEVHATDLVDRGCPDAESRVDFLLPGAGERFPAIVTNPPYKLAEPFLDKALGLAPYVAMLLRINWLASTGRKALFRATPPARVHISCRRLPMMHRGGDGYTGERASSQMDYAWFVWDRRHAGPSELHWFDWRDSA